MKTNPEEIGYTGAGGRDNLFVFPQGLIFYGELLGNLSKTKLSHITTVFAGACGLGADVLAAGRSFRGEITAVSYGDVPLPEVRQELGERLTFYEGDFITYLRQARKADQKFDLILLFEVPTDDILEKGFYPLLRDTTNDGGFVLNLWFYGIPLKRQLMNTFFEETALASVIPTYSPKDLRFIQLWRKRT